MRDIASIHIVWNKQGQLLLDYSGQTNVPANQQKEHQALSVPLLCANQMCVLEPRTCQQLCKGIYEIAVDGNLSPRPIKDILKEARLELKEISSDTGEKLLVAMFHSKLKRFGFVGYSADEAIERLIENYAKHILTSGIEPDALRLSLVTTAFFYLSRLQQVGVGKIVSEMRTFHYSFSYKVWPKMQQATQEQLKNAVDHFQAALQSV